jgi:hypothetical protein
VRESTLKYCTQLLVNVDTADFVVAKVFVEYYLFLLKKKNWVVIIPFEKTQRECWARDQGLAKKFSAYILFLTTAIKRQTHTH